MFGITPPLFVAQVNCQTATASATGNPVKSKVEKSSAYANAAVLVDKCPCTIKYLRPAFDTSVTGSLLLTILVNTTYVLTNLLFTDGVETPSPLSYSIYV